MRILPRDEAALVLEQISIPELEDTLGLPLDRWRQACHEISLRLVRSGLITERTGHRARVARGKAPRVGSQHSWVVLGANCYDPGTLVVDLTRWSYDPHQPVVLVGTAHDLGVIPHGHASILTYGRPSHQGGPTIELEPKTRLDPHSQAFLDMLGPLDIRGWTQLACAPVLDWPSPQIISAMYETEALRALVPIDVVGMLTEHNPEGLYF